MARAVSEVVVQVRRIDGQLIEGSKWAELRSVNIGSVSERIDGANRQTVRAGQEWSSAAGKSPVECHPEFSTERCQRELDCFSEAMARSQADAQGRDQRSQELEDSQHALPLRVTSLERELQDCGGNLERLQVQGASTSPLAV